MKIFYHRHFIKHPCTTRTQHCARAIWFNTSLHIYWYLQHAAVNDTKTHGHQYLSSRAAPETFAALPLLPTHFAHLLMARNDLSFIVATTPVLNTALHMGMSPQGTGGSSPFGNTPLVGCTDSWLLCPDTQVASGGKHQHPAGGSGQSCALQDPAFLPRSPCESYFFPRAAGLTCAPPLSFQLQWGTCTAAGSSVLSLYSNASTFLHSSVDKGTCPTGTVTVVPSATSFWRLPSVGLMVGDVPENSPKRCWNSRRSISPLSNNRPADWAPTGIVTDSQNTRVYTSPFLFY